MKEIEQILYVDPQAEKPAMLCPVCGGELYFPSCFCLRCERRKQWFWQN